MPFKKIQLRPGIVRDVTNFSNEGGWYDCDNVRFRMGMPESIGGWIELLNGGSTTNALETTYGVCRCLHQWTTLAGQQFTAIGTDKKLLLLNQTTVSNITPVGPPITLLPNPLKMIQAPGVGPPTSNSLRVEHIGHGRVTGDSVIISGATAVGGFSAVDINKEFQIEVIDADSYRISMATSVPFISTSGGGSAVVATYEIPIGSASNTFVSGGWGVGTWGQGTWGTPRSGLESGIRIWSIDNFGEDLVAAIIGGKIYYWDASVGVGARAVELSSIAGSNQCPTINSAGIAVSEGDRHLLVFGANEVGSAAADPLLIRWGNQESLVEWEPRRDTTAGGLRVSAGSRIIAQTRGRQETVIWTDIGINALTFVGPPYTFGLNTTAQNVSIVGPNAVIEARNQLYWMDLNAFRFYNGSVNSLPCTVQSYVFDDFNWFQRAKVCAGHNSRFNEVWWWYPSADSIENNRYVAYNYVDNYWIIGSMSRTAWLDSSFSGYPIAWGTEINQYRLFQHETGVNRILRTLSGNLQVYSLASHVEGSDLTLLDGESFAFISRIAPDFSKTGASTNGPVVFEIKQRNFPQNTSAAGFSGALVSTSNPKELFVRVRTRQFALRVSSNTIDLGWRLGTTRFDIREDGRKQ
jgi:hypothetical protein